MIQVFSKNWFELHQAKLLRFANSKIGRYILRIHGKRSDVGENKIVKILPHAITWISSEKNGSPVYKTEFRTHDKFGKRLYYTFKPVWYLMHFLDWLLLDRFVLVNKYSFGFATLGPIYPAAGANSPVDGQVRREGVTESFATIRGGAGVTAVITGITHNISLDADATSDTYKKLQRGIVLFDTSSLTAAATVTAATFSVNGFDKTNGLGSDTFEVVSSTPGADNTVVASDYSQLGTTSFASVAYASYSTTGYNDCSLNASGISNISKTGNSKFGTRLGWDLNNSFTGVWAHPAQTYLNYYSADAAGTTTDPKLVVTYTLPVLSGGTATMMGI